MSYLKYIFHSFIGLERFESIIREILLQRYNERSEKQLSISVDIEPIIVDHHEEKPNCC